MGAVIKKLPVYVSVDPGLKGAVCALLPDKQMALFMDTTEQPETILNWLQRLKSEYDLRVIMIENVHAIQGTSAKSNFSFGFNTGAITAIARCTGVTVDTVNPKKWQKHCGVKPKEKQLKKAVAEICGKLYPKVVVKGPKGGLLDGKSDSLMIAHYARSLY